MVLTKEIGL